MSKRDLCICMTEEVAKAVLGAVRAEMMGFEPECLDKDGIEYFDKLMKGGALLLEEIERAEAKRKEDEF